MCYRPIYCLKNNLIMKYNLYLSAYLRQFKACVCISKSLTSWIEKHQLILLCVLEIISRIYFLFYNFDGIENIDYLFR